MAGKCIEIAVERLHVHRHVRHRLRAVHQHDRADRVCLLDDRTHRVDGAEGIGTVGDADKLGALRQQFAEPVEQQLTGVIDRDNLERRAHLLAQHLPRHDVGVVFHFRNENLVALPDVGPAPGLGHQIDGLGRAAHEHDFLRAARVEERTEGRARALVGRGGALAQSVHAAMDIGVIEAIVVVQRLDHRRRLLGGGGVVEVHQRLAVHHLAQNREIRAHARDIEPGGRRLDNVQARLVHRIHTSSSSRIVRPCSRRAIRRCSSCRRTAGSRMRASTSLANA